MNVRNKILRKVLPSFIAIAVFGCQNASSPAFSVDDDTKKVKAILKTIDDTTLNMDAKMSIYSDDVVHMAQGSRAITNKADLRKVLESEASGGKTLMTHELVTLHSYPDMVLTRGGVKGNYHPNGGGKAIPFETNNILTFKRNSDGTLKVWQVIFNRVNLENY